MFDFVNLENWWVEWYGSEAELYVFCFYLFIILFNLLFYHLSNIILSILRIVGWSGMAVRRNDRLLQDLRNSFSRDYKMYPSEPAQKFMYD